jgi:cytochrome c oxidase cbb3-type subunit III
VRVVENPWAAYRRALARAVNRLRLLVLFSVFVASAGGAVEPQQLAGQVPNSPSRSIEAGKVRFESLCSACHGIQARGGRGGAPDLLLSTLVVGDVAGFRQFVRAGSPAAGMPGFALEDEALSAVHAYLQQIASAAKRRGIREISIVGNPDRGKSYFEGPGGCMACHSVTGDFQHLGSRYNPRVLQGRIALPRGSGVHPGLTALGVRIPGVTDEAPVRDSPQTVTVTPSGGASVSGLLLSISDFNVSLRDQSGIYHSFERRHGFPRIEVHDPIQPHLDTLGRLNDQDLHDLTAYLATLK